MTLIPWKDDRCLAWDFTCPDKLAPSRLNLASTGIAAIANDAEDRKRYKYVTSLSPSFIFVPIAVETFGVLGDAASEFMYELGKRISAVSGEPRSKTFLLQRLSVAIQRGNAASVLGTVNLSIDLDVIFYL